MNKIQCRREILAKRGLLSQKDVIEYSYEIKQKLYSIEEYKNAETILIYVSYNNEVDTIELIEDALKQKKLVAVPKVIDKEKGIMQFYYINSISDLKRGYMGILEPLDGNVYDISGKNNKVVIVCPGVAFDVNCNRIGYGGGYYDRYLSKANVVSIALAYDFQIFDKIETEEHDNRVDMIVSPKRVIS